MSIETLNPAETAEFLRSLGMRISPEVVRQGLEDRRFPFGDYIPTGEGKGRCFIYKRLLDAWVAERTIKSKPPVEPVV